MGYVDGSGVVAVSIDGAELVLEEGLVLGFLYMARYHYYYREDEGIDIIGIEGR